MRTAVHGGMSRDAFAPKGWQRPVEINGERSVIIDDLVDSCATAIDKPEGRPAISVADHRRTPSTFSTASGPSRRCAYGRYSAKPATNFSCSSSAEAASLVPVGPADAFGQCSPDVRI
jgi:hypothetical protein